MHDRRDQELNGSKSLVVTIPIVNQRHGNIIEAHDQHTRCVCYLIVLVVKGHVLYLVIVIVAVNVKIGTCACKQPTRQLCCSVIESNRSRCFVLCNAYILYYLKLLECCCSVLAHGIYRDHTLFAFRFVYNFDCKRYARY